MDHDMLKMTIVPVFRAQTLLVYPETTLF